MPTPSFPGELKRTWEEMSGDGSQTAYNFHLANCWKAHQTKNMFNMPWDLTMTAPHEVHQKSLQLFTWDKHLTPMPVINPLEPSQDLAGCLEDAFKRVGLKAAKSSDTRLWEERLSWERKCACKKVVHFDLAEHKSLGHWRQVFRIWSFTICKRRTYGERH